jgi:hypothetical protein
MSDIEKKALVLLNEVWPEIEPWTLDDIKGEACFETLCRAIEQHEAFRQEVSDAVEAYNDLWRKRTPGRDEFMGHFIRFIIAKPDPLVEAMADCGVDRFETWADQLREALAKRGGKIVWREGH